MVLQNIKLLNKPINCSVLHNIYNIFLSSENDEKICYVHTVSPVKKSQTTGTEYFDCTLQMENASKRAVCFTPTKRKLLVEYEEAKSPVKIAKCNSSKGNGDIIINQYSRITPVNSESLAFTFNANLAKHNVVELGELDKLATWQLISTKASVASISDPFNHQGSLNSKWLSAIKLLVVP